MKYDVPFYANTPDGTSCTQAALRSLLKYFWPEKEFSWNDLNKITGKIPALWTWQLDMILWLKDQGLAIEYWETFDYRIFISQGGKYLIDEFGEEVGMAQIANSDIDQAQRSAQRFIEEISIHQEVPNNGVIKDSLLADNLVLVTVNSRTLNQQDGYEGHFILVIGFDDHGFYIHDSGPPPLENRHVSFDLLDRAWSYEGEQAKLLCAVGIAKNYSG